MSALNESIVEDAALTWFGDMNYTVGHEPHWAHGELLMKPAEPHFAEATL